jgi:hypothetical protein
MAITTRGQAESATYGAIKLAGLAGVVSIALGIAGSIVDEMRTFPGTGAKAGEIAGYVDAHRSALLVAMVLSTAAVGLWLPFGVGVWVWLRETTGSVSLLAVCFLVGLVSFVTLLLAGFAVFFVFVYRAPEASDPRLLYDLAFGLLAMSGVPTALALGSYAAQALRDSRLPDWTAWVAVVAALAHLGLLASLVITNGFFSLEGGVIIAIPATLFAWIAGTSIVLLRTGTYKQSLPNGPSSSPACATTCTGRPCPRGRRAALRVLTRPAGYRSGGTPLWCSPTRRTGSRTRMRRWPYRWGRPRRVLAGRRCPASASAPSGARCVRDVRGGARRLGVGGSLSQLSTHRDSRHAPRFRCSPAIPSRWFEILGRDEP